jgi:hypothetical protein
MFFVSFLKVNDEDPDPYPLVRGMDPRIRIRMHTKMSWIRNTDMQYRFSSKIRLLTSQLVQVCSMKTRAQQF